MLRVDRHGSGLRRVRPAGSASIPAPARATRPTRRHSAGRSTTGWASGRCAACAAIRTTPTRLVLAARRRLVPVQARAALHGAPDQALRLPACGAVTAKWTGRCESCGDWNTIVEEAAPRPARPAAAWRAAARAGCSSSPASTGTTPQPPRYQTGIAEFDRVCGGGLVRGSAILIGGDPGIGKSTLLLQVAAALAAQQAAVRLHLRRGGGRPGAAARRAPGPGRRAGAARRRDLACATSSPRLERPDAPERRGHRFDPDHVARHARQRARHRRPRCAPRRRRWSRSPSGAASRVMLVGHVTKDGQIAGPRVLEHMVDTVLYFEGERGHQFRILRAVKNRFGPTDEIGVFEMTDRGLAEVANPSALFLAERRGHVSGAAVFAGIEGTRPVLVEIQALVAPSALGTPRRAVVGWDCEPAGHGAGGAGGALRPRASAPTTSISTSPAACGSASRRRTWRWRRRWSRRSPTSRCRADMVVFGEIGLSRRGPAGRPARGAAEGGRQAGLPQRAGAARRAGSGPRRGRPRASSLTKSSIWPTLSPASSR